MTPTGPIVLSVREPRVAGQGCDHFVRSRGRYPKHIAGGGSVEVSIRCLDQRGRIRAVCRTVQSMENLERAGSRIDAEDKSAAIKTRPLTEFSASQHRTVAERVGF